MSISSPLVLLLAIMYFFTMVFAVFLVIQEERYGVFIKIFLALFFFFVPFSGLIYLLLNYKKIPQLVN